MLNKYEIILKKVISDLGNNITYSDVLDKYCKYVIPKKNNFLGVFSQDFDKDILKKHKQCCLLFNTSPSWKEGEHWLALWKENDKLYTYDSFGRNPERLTPILNKNLGGNVIYEDEKEQENHEMKCGQRSITWLLCCCKFGIENAITI
jgi:hypothetical protein